ESSPKPKAIVEAENFSYSTHGFSVGDFNVFKLADGGNALGYRFGNEQLTYHTSLEKGSYQMNLNIASECKMPGAVEISIDGEVVGTIQLETTGGHSNYREFSSQVFEVTSSGPVTLSLKFQERSIFFIDKITLVRR